MVGEFVVDTSLVANQSVNLRSGLTGGYSNYISTMHFMPDMLGKVESWRLAFLPLFAVL